MSVQAIPDQYRSLIPYLCVRDAAAAIEFYKSLFGATEMFRMIMPGSSKVGHAEMRIHGHLIMLGDEAPDYGVVSPLALNGPSPVALMLYVEDVDTLFAKAVEMGAKPLVPPANMFWGDRFAKFCDPFGHNWSLATHVEDVSPEEMEKRMAAGACG